MSHRRAIIHLKRVDPVMATVIKAVGPCRFTTREDGTHFQALARSIVFQQLSTKAANTIHLRFEALFDDKAPVPSTLLELPDDTLRAVGLSRQKTSYLRDLASRAQSGEVPVETLHELSDADVIAALTQVKGIGRWTAQMFLIFRLGRPDILPDLDLGIQNAIRRAYRMRKAPTPDGVLKVGMKWAPYRTIASWYLWRSLDVEW